MIDHHIGVHHWSSDVCTKVAALASSQNMCLPYTWRLNNHTRVARHRAIWLELHDETFWTGLVSIRAGLLCRWREHVRGTSAYLPTHFLLSIKSD